MLHIHIYNMDHLVYEVHVLLFKIAGSGVKRFLKDANQDAKPTLKKYCMQEWAFLNQKNCFFFLCPR